MGEKLWKRWGEPRKGGKTGENSSVRTQQTRWHELEKETEEQPLTGGKTNGN